MARFLEFFTNHWLLAGLWIILFCTLLAYLKKKAGRTVSTHEATRLINREDAVVLDIRDKKVFDKGHIVNAINIPLSKLDERITELDKNKAKPFIVVCQMGQQSGDAVKKLEARAYPQVFRMTGGIGEWQAQGLPLVI